MISFVLAIHCLAGAHGLHELLHLEAGDTGHECAITLFAHGLVEAATTELALCPPPPLVPPLAVLPAPLLLDPPAQLPPGRGPPSRPA